jgi:hypothetical protein
MEPLSTYAEDANYEYVVANEPRVAREGDLFLMADEGVQRPGKGSQLVELPTTEEERKEIARIADVPEDHVHKLDIRAAVLRAHPMHFLADFTDPALGNTGAARILLERQRQIRKEGWDAEHDDAHVNHELAQAAICYIRQAIMEGLCVWRTHEVEGTLANGRVTILPSGWPMTWSPVWWKPEPKGTSGSPLIELKDAVRMLEKAGALVAAEIDRLLRSADLVDDGGQE